MAYFPANTYRSARPTSQMPGTTMMPTNTTPERSRSGNVAGLPIDGSQIL